MHKRAHIEFGSFLEVAGQGSRGLERFPINYFAGFPEAPVEAGDGGEGRGPSAELLMDPRAVSR